MSKTPINYGNYYHIFNRGNNDENIFLKTEHYKYFLKLYGIYIEPIADTFAWCLMKNHFHILLRIKEENEIGFLNSENAKEADLAQKWSVYFPEKPEKPFLKKPQPSRMFQHLFSAYSHWFNKRTGRKNSLFAREFERKLIDNSDYYRNLIIYINNNPVHHGFVEHPLEYTWCSYKTSISESPTKLKRKQVIKIFDDIDNFKYMHNQKLDIEKIKEYIIE